jgi:hypothetical protein
LKLQVVEKLKPDAERLESLILPTTTILSSYLLRTHGILSCKLCDFLAAHDSHINAIMSHLHDAHNIKRKDGSFAG